jgi:hypothetical protein
MNETYDNENYTENCRSCGTANLFYKEREIFERQHLNIGDGYVDIDSEDIDGHSEWKFYCGACGTSSDDLEDLLEEKDLDEEDEEF